MSQQAGRARSNLYFIVATSSWRPNWLSVVRGCCMMELKLLARLACKALAPRCLAFPCLFLGRGVSGGSPSCSCRDQFPLALGAGAANLQGRRARLSLATFFSSLRFQGLSRKRWVVPPLHAFRRPRGSRGLYNLTPKWARSIATGPYGCTSRLGSARPAHAPTSHHAQAGVWRCLTEDGLSCRPVHTSTCRRRQQDGRPLRQTAHAGPAAP